MYRMIVPKTPEQLDKMAAAGAILTRCLHMLAAGARPGVTTKESTRRRRSSSAPRRRRRPSRATAGSRARSAPRPTRWSSTASPAPTNAARRRALDRRRRGQGRLGGRRRDDRADRRGLTRMRPSCSTSPRRRSSPAPSRCGRATTSATSPPRSSARSRSRGSRSSAPWSGTGSAARCTKTRRSRTSASRARGPRLEEGPCWRSSHGQRRRPAGRDGRRRLGRLLEGRLAGGPLRVHDRGRRRRPRSSPPGTSRTDALPADQVFGPRTRRPGPRSTSTSPACWRRPTRRWTRRCAQSRRRDFPRSRSRPRRASCSPCWRRRSGPAPASSSAPWAATARSGWAGRCPADGRLITLEANPEYAEVARPASPRAGLGELGRGQSRPGFGGPACARARGSGPFDLVFIDADKVHTPDYFAWALERTRPGGLIVADNVIREAPRRPRGQRPGDRRPAPLPRAARRRAAGRGDDDPDRRRQGLRRLHDRPGPVKIFSSVSEFARLRRLRQHAALSNFAIIEAKLDRRSGAV